MRTRTLLIYGSVFFACTGVLLLNSCSNNDMSVTPNINEIDESGWNSLRESAFKTFADAQQEFFTDVPSVLDVKKLTPKDLLETVSAPAGVDSVVWNHVEADTQKVFSEPATEDYNVKEKILSLAWESQYSGDNSKLMAYLKENNLYEKYLEIMAKYNINQLSKSLSLRKKDLSIDKFLSSDFLDGDIFLRYDKGGSSSGSINGVGWLIPGKWDHAGFMDTKKRNSGSSNFILSASPYNDQDNSGTVFSARVGYDKIDGYWTASQEVSVTRVNGANSNQRRAAVEFCQKFIGLPFDPITDRLSNDKFYCSKVVYRGWLSQGYEIEPHKDSFTGIPWVYVPSGIAWKTMKIGFFTVAYPVVIFSLWKDTWVTPTDLSEDDNTSCIATF
jgi:hypothetical protein